MEDNQAALNCVKIPSLKHLLYRLNVRRGSRFCLFVRTIAPQKAAPGRSPFTITERWRRASGVVSLLANGCAAHAWRKLLTLHPKTCYVFALFTRSLTGQDVR